MDTEFWKNKWHAQDIAFNQIKPNELLQRYIGALPLKSGDRIFVPLCGKSIDMIWLVHQGYEVVGVEISPLACEAFFKENGMSIEKAEEDEFTVFQSPHITIFSGDFFLLNNTMLGTVNAVYDRAALIALPLDRRKKYVEHLKNLIQPATPMLLITTEYPQGEMPGPPFSVGEEDVHALFEGSITHQLYNKPIKSLPEHLMRKGLVKANEQAYYIK